MSTIINHIQPGGCYDAHGSQCPPWCIVARDPELPHVGEYSAVPLTLSGELLLGRLEKGYSSPGTYVALVHMDRYDLDLTLAEAAELSGLLAALIARAVTQDPGCGLPPEPQQARARECPLCGAAPGIACQPDPSGDHLARYLDAYTAGQLTREFMAAVLGELVVVASWRIVPDGAA